ncbi:MAG TPA: phage tail protein, partial [Thermodesulfobacteriota bacterium]|nr:phage tail protein [Thermodesulfobacteriota bacterium]
AQNINKYELYRIARYCDELIPDGKGGLEPRFTCNLYITEVQDAQKILSDMASIFRGILIWTEGTLTPVQDAVKDPVYTFTRGNVIDGRFSYETGSERTRSNQINVTWTDPEKFYKRSIEIVDDPKDIAERGKIITKDIVAFGCTSQGQAHRLGKWYLLTESLENTLVKFKTGINAAFLRPGDLVNIQDQSQTNVGGSGRVSNTQPASTTSVYLDRDFVPDGGGEYELSLIYPAYSAYLQQATARINGVVYSRGDLITQAYVDGNLTNLDTSSDVANATDDDGNLIGLSWSNFSRIETKPVSSWGNFGGKAIAIVSSAFSDTPTSETIWALSKTNDSNIRTKTRQFRVVSIAEDENYEFNVVGHEYIKGKFDAVDRGYEVTPITNSPIPTFDREPLARPTNLVVSIVPASDEDVSDKGEKELIASSFYDVSISWRRPLRGTTALELDRYFSHTEVRHNFTADRGFITLNAGKGYNITLRDPGSIFGIHSVFIRFVDTLGRKSKWVRTEINFNKNSKPSAPQPPQLNAVGSIVLGGTLDALVHITSDGTELNFNPPNFVLKAPQGPAYQITGAPILDYSSLPSGQSAYIWFDAGNRGVGDEASGSPGNFLAVNRITDTDARTPSGRPRNYTYYKQLTSSSPDLTQIATVDLDISTTEFVDGLAIPVFPKTFNIDQYIDPAVITPGQVIRIGEGSPAWWGSIESVDSSSPGAPSFSITTREGVNKSFLASTSPGVFVTNFKPNWFDDFIIGQVYNNAGVFSLNIFSGNQGAQLGSNLLDEAGNVLYNLDVANDQLAIGDIGAINANSGFKLSRRRQTGPTEGRGDLFPAYWFLSDTDQNSIRYYSPAVRDEVLINDGRLVANALKITQ